MCHSAGRLLPALGRVEGPTRAALIGVSIHADPPWDIGSYLLYHHHCYHHIIITYHYHVLYYCYCYRYCYYYYYYHYVLL